MAEEEFIQKHKEYSLLLDWPPFSTSHKKSDGYRDDVIAEDKRIMAAAEAGEDDAYERMYSTLEAKWADDLEEARLYQKRYPNSRNEAKQAALKAEGKENQTWEDDSDIPSDDYND